MYEKKYLGFDHVEKNLRAEKTPYPWNFLMSMRSLAQQECHHRVTHLHSQFKGKGFFDFTQFEELFLIYTKRGKRSHSSILNFGY